jgi:hypothetical protein
MAIDLLEPRVERGARQRQGLPGRVRLTSLSELADCDIDSPSVIVFPFDSERSAAPDPSRHPLSAGIELLLLSTAALSQRFGEPDFPSAAAPVPDRYLESSVAAVVWDFDYYQLVLDLSESRGVYRVRLRRTNGGAVPCRSSAS